MPRHPLLPTPLDNLTTLTSESQTAIESEIVKYLKPYYAQEKTDSADEQTRSVESIVLRRSDHISFLYSKLVNLSAHWTVIDASRSWIMYWVVGSLSLLDVRITPEERDRAIQTILSFQHPDGGFGGGPGHLAHLAGTYASICSLAILLEDVDLDVIRDTWAKVDIKKLYDWMVRMKVPGGGFAVQREGEVNSRGIYGALAVATMLNLLTPELVKDLPEYLVSCQTHEGGMTASEITFPGKRTGAPIGEAHGGYASCAVASYFILQGIPNLITPSHHINHEASLRWVVQTQAFPIEGGGFRGRTNKLVDDNLKLPDLYDRQALQEYILLASHDQPPTKNEGGLRDKPGMAPDLYHTHYVLAGLSLAQHSPTYSRKKVQQLTETFKPPQISNVMIKNDGETEEQIVERMKGVYCRTLGWEFDPDRQMMIGTPSNKVGQVNPILNMRQSAAEKIMNYFYHQSSESLGVTARAKRQRTETQDLTSKSDETRSRNQRVNSKKKAVREIEVIRSTPVPPRSVKTGKSAHKRSAKHPGS